MSDQNFEVVSGEDVLSVQAKACLLRAARTELRKMQAELYRLQTLPPRHMAGPIATTEAEIDCLAQGITWLWNHRGSGP